MTNKDYQQLNKTSREIAKLDLEKMVRLGILERKGSGRSTCYIISGKWVKMSNGLQRIGPDRGGYWKVKNQ